MIKDNILKFINLSMEDIKVIGNYVILMQEVYTRVHSLEPITQQENYIHLHQN